MATIKATSHQAFGNMTGGLSLSLSVLMTLASTTLGGSMPTILQKFSMNTTNVPLTGMDSNTLAWTWTGTMTAARSTSQFLSTSLRPSCVSNTKLPANRSTNHTHTSSPTTEQRCSTQKTRTPWHCSPPKDKKFMQVVISTFLYYAQCVNSTMLASLGSIVTQQANPTKNTMKMVREFLDYTSTHPDTIIMCRASDMVLMGHSNSSYLSKP